MIAREFPGPSSSRIMEELDSLGALELKWASPEMGSTVGADKAGLSSISGSRLPSRQSSFTGGAPTPGWRTPPGPSMLAAAAVGAGGSAANTTYSVPSSRPLTPPKAIAAGGAQLPPDPVTGLPLRTSQQQVLSNLLRVRALVKATAARLEQSRIHAFLDACSVGNMDRIRLVGGLGAHLHSQT